MRRNLIITTIIAIITGLLLWPFADDIGLQIHVFGRQSEKVETYEPDDQEPDCVRQIRDTCDNESGDSALCLLMQPRPTETPGSIHAFVAQMHARKGMRRDQQKDLICARLMGRKKFSGFYSLPSRWEYELSPNEASPTEVLIPLWQNPDGEDVVDVTLRCPLPRPAIEDFLASLRELAALTCNNESKCEDKLFPISFGEVNGVVTNVEIIQDDLYLPVVITLSTCSVSSTSSPYTTGTLQDQKDEIDRLVRDEFNSLIHTGLSRRPPPDTRFRDAQKAGYLTGGVCLFILILLVIVRRFPHKRTR